MSKGRSIDPAVVALAAQDMEFSDLSAFGDGSIGVFRAGAGGPSPWEMHPECDELLQVLVGVIEVEMLPPQGPARVTRVAAGALLVVPQGCWHRQTLIEASIELYLTPGPSLHSTDADPRLQAEAALP